MICKRCYWIAGILGLLNAGGLHGATISWTNTSGGLWSAPANWDAQFVPRSFDSVNITAAGTYTVTVDTSVNVVGLTIGGATGQQTLTNYSQNFSVSGILEIGRAHV